jgi:hypothetical protein
MNMRRGVALLLTLLTTSTVIGWVLASTCWVDNLPIDLGPNTDNAMFLVVNLVGDAVSSSWISDATWQNALAAALKETLPDALREIAAKSVGVAETVGSDVNVPGLCIRWRDDKSTYECAAGVEPYACTDSLAGGASLDVENDRLRIVAIHYVVRFSNDAVESASLWVCMNDRTSELPPVRGWAVNDGSLWANGQVAYPVSDGPTWADEETQRVYTMSVQMKPLDGEGASAWIVPDLLRDLASRVETHLRGFAASELESTLGQVRPDSDRTLHDVSLLIHRGGRVRVDGEIDPNCWCRHTARANGCGIAQGTSTVPVVNGSGAYGLFGP